MNCIDDLNQVKERWFLMEGGGRVQFKTVLRHQFMEIQKQTVKKKVDFKKVDGTPGRFPFEEVDENLQNELFWDASIISWDEFYFKHPETGEKVLCTPATCTRENKTLLMNCSKKFSSFAVESLKVLSEDETKQAEIVSKN